LGLPRALLRRLDDPLPRPAPAAAGGRGCPAPEFSVRGGPVAGPSWYPRFHGRLAGVPVL